MFIFKFFRGGSEGGREDWDVMLMVYYLLVKAMGGMRMRGKLGRKGGVR